MPVYNSQMFFLGNAADMDVNEASSNTENANAILGSYSQPPLIDIAVDDINGDVLINDDDVGATSESFTYDTGAGSTSQLLDSTQTYMADVLLGDGSTSTIEVTVIQMKNGDVFLTDFTNFGTLDNLKIQSVELISVTGSNYTSFYADSSVDNSAVVCFTPGSLIDTDRGSVPVEKLRPGHLVRTLDHEYQPVCWIGSRTLYSSDLLANPHLRPVIIRKGALGNVRRMLVSPQHGFLIDGRLIRAKHLAEYWGGKVARVDWRSECVTYIHFLCDQHEIVFADGAASESLYLGPVALAALGRMAITELQAIFPALVSGLETREAIEAIYGSPARRYMRGCEARLNKSSRRFARELTSFVSDFRPEFVPDDQLQNH